MQKKFLHINPTITQSLTDALEYINAAVDLFREKELPIVSVQHINEECDLVPGNEGFELPDELDALPSDPHITKNYSNAFNSTPLADELRNLGVDAVVVSCCVTRTVSRLN